jgi:hypothetical protein
LRGFKSLEELDFRDLKDLAGLEVFLDKVDPPPWDSSANSLDFFNITNTLRFRLLSLV